MIHHLSVSARDPKAVADFFVAVTGGVAVDFQPCPGSYMVFKADGRGTAVEIYPADTVLEPAGPDGAAFVRGATAPRRSPTHFALSVEADLDRVRALAAERGWTCEVCDRGGHFHVIEVWVENDWMVEILPPDFAAEYLDFADAVARMTDPDRALDSHRPKDRALEPA